MPGDAPASAGDLRRRALLAAVVACTLLAVVFAAFRFQWSWGLFDLFSFRPPYADTIALLAAGQARHAGLDVYAPNPFDPMRRPHVYGPGWLVSGALGLTVGDAKWLGPLLIAAFVVAAALVLAPRRWRDLGVVFALFCTPPVMLGIDRANNDLVVFLLLAAGAWLLARSQFCRALGGAIIGLAATLKMYPFAALPVLALGTGKRRAALLLAGVVSAGCVAVLWIWRNDYRMALSLTPNPQTVFAYGLMVTTLTWRSLAGFHTWFVVGLLAGGSLGLAALAPRARRLWTCVPADGFSAFAFLAGAACWIFCFLAAMNLPYRLVLLLLPARLWLEQVDAPADRGTARVQLWLWAIVGWLQFPKQSWALIAQSDPHVTIPAWKWLVGLCGVEQALLIVLTVALAVSAAGAFVRWWWARPVGTARVAAGARA